MPARYSTNLAAVRMRKRRWARGSSDFSGDPEYRHPELVLGFRVNRNCPLCGDGFAQLKRECRLHPELCDACDREYCECTVEDKVELKPLEEIILLREEARVPLLKARKMTLRLAGRNTNSMPEIIVRHEPQTAYVSVTHGGWQEDDPWRENAKRALEEADGNT